MDNTPAECLHLIFEYLTLSQLLTLKMVSKLFCYQHFGSLDSSLILKEFNSNNGDEKISTNDYTIKFVPQLNSKTKRKTRMKIVRIPRSLGRFFE
jgi:hypothetical protein